MTKLFQERNQSETARRKVKNLATASCLDIDFVSALADFMWDYDPTIGNEAIGWVRNDTLTEAASEQLHGIAETVGLAFDFELTRDRAVNDLIQAHSRVNLDTLWSNFLTAAVNKNFGRISEFASHYYLRGLCPSNAYSLPWGTKPVGMIDIAGYLFLKLFRGGAIERNDLAYLWCDLVIGLDYHELPPSHDYQWLEPLLSGIDALPSKSGLKCLVACCQGLVSGDKFFKQEVLQALAYADVLRVTGLPVSEMFLPDRHDELSSHFYSNEWSFPLRFWSSNGGSVNREGIPSVHCKA